MQELQYECKDGSFTYVRQGRGIEITGYQGLAGHVEIPGELPVGVGSGDLPTSTLLSAEHKEGNFADVNAEGVRLLPVTGIAKKVFLSKKYLRSIIVPASVEEVGDWAFAYCDSLREVHFGGKSIRFGKDVFLQCPKLRGLYFAEDQAETEDGEGHEMTRVQEATQARGVTQANKMTEGVAALLAAAVTQMESPYLLDAQEAGSANWLGKWDARMLAILHAPDEEGYSKQILCGEEDYESADLETYLANSRKKKARLLLLRLLWPFGLGPVQEKELKDYLLAHTKGCKTEEAWLVIREEYGDRRELYELFARLGCFTKENAAAIIAQTPEEHPEMKAFFLKYQADHFTGVDFFGNLEL